MLWLLAPPSESVSDGLTDWQCLNIKTFKGDQSLKKKVRIFICHDQYFKSDSNIEGFRGISEEGETFHLSKPARNVGLCLYVEDY